MFLFSSRRRHFALPQINCLPLGQDGFDQIKAILQLFRYAARATSSHSFLLSEKNLAEFTEDDRQLSLPKENTACL